MRVNNPTPAETTKAYRLAMAFASRLAPGTNERADAAKDAATDAVVWALSRYDPRLGSFEAFALSAVRRFVGRKIKVLNRKAATRPAVGELTEEMPAVNPDRFEAIALGVSIRELPDDLRDTVRLFYIDRYTMRDCGLLLGCALATVRKRLRRAARILDAGRPNSRYGTGTRRMKA